MSTTSPALTPLLGCWTLVQGSQRTPLQAPGRRPGLGDARGSHGSLTYSPATAFQRLQAGAQHTRV